MQDSIVVRTMDGRITYMNGSAERLYGWAMEEVLGPMALVHDGPVKPFHDRTLAAMGLG